MKVKYIAFVIAAMVVASLLFGIGSAQAYTFAEVSGTSTLSEQSLTTSTDSLSYDQTLSNGDDVYVEAGQDLAPTCIQSATHYCPSSSPTTSTTTLSASTITPYLITSCPGPWYEVGYHGTVRYRNHLGFLLWKYKQVLWYYYCPSLYPSVVEKIAKLNSLAVYTNYGWSWQGTVAGPSHNSLPDTYIATYSKGWFQVCTPVLSSVYCENRYPHIRLYANGYGHLTGMKWGITSS